MSLLKFQKSELVNRSYSLKREIISAGKTGAYCNTSIVTCNTRRYHGLLAVTLDRFGGDKYLMLSSVDESIIIEGKRFNLGIHCYGDIYEPRGHKYIVDFNADRVPTITYAVGNVVFRKSLLLVPDKDQILVRYELVEAPCDVTLELKPFLAFRNVHELTHRNDVANTGYTEIDGGVSFRMYESFPDLFIQLSDKKAKYLHNPVWNMGITYSDEYRRGFDCVEDLLVPGHFEMKLSKGGSVILSAATLEHKSAGLAASYKACFDRTSEVTNNRGQLVRCADQLITNHNGRMRINAGLSWMYTGLLRETLRSLPGLALYGLESAKVFEEILDNLIADQHERLSRRTTQVEAPLLLAAVLQSYIEWGADSLKVWKKYGGTVRMILESYLPGNRAEVTMHPNGLLWAQMDGVALSWMNAYIDGRAVTERAGYQVETNAYWYNAICFALEMEEKSGGDGAFISKWSGIRNLVKANYQRTFLIEDRGYLADYVDNSGRNTDVRPNQLMAIAVKYSPIDEELHPSILRVIDSELVTYRGIRTLSPRDVKYKGVYEGSQYDRDLAYHQGCTRPSLLEPYIITAFRIKGVSFVKKAEWLSEGFYEDLGKHGVGAFAEIYDGDPPFEAHGAISSALSTAALLVVDHYIEKYRKEVAQ